ncbi:hypothetical protein [Vibrio sp. B1Z05]|uniref:hypothetical protein n=1 Tax=Vibrio sp. B1Z05 TaxID=2654980 RepID=UPI00128B1B45|nr:hypothetical protein [Vibrio sp. B1Z05]MPW36266.1 hypothetical protein [Vibrio sp. B1Z05]
MLDSPKILSTNFIKYITLLFLHLLLWSATVSTLWGIYRLELYGIIYISILIFNVFLSQKNKLSQLFGLSSFIYFYQVPFVLLFPITKEIEYRYEFSGSDLFEYLLLYNVVLICLCLINVIISKIDFKTIIYRIEKDKSLNIITNIALAFSVLLMIHTFLSIGGLHSYLSLNKFEASEAQSLGYFSFKDFASLYILLGAISSKTRKQLIIYFSFCSLFLFFEMISAKRFLILVFVVAMFLFKFREIKVRHFFYGLCSLFVMSFLKFTYYNIRLFVKGDDTFLSIFWFDWSDLFLDTVFLGESRAHMILTANYITKHITFQPEMFLNQIIVSFPFGHRIVPNFQTASSYLMTHLNVDWVGLASSQYITPYLSLGLFGVFICYSLHSVIISFLSYAALHLKNLFFAYLLIAISPILFFYAHREELVLVIKSMIVQSVAIFILFCTAYIIMQITTNLIYKRRV